MSSALRENYSRRKCSNVLGGFVKISGNRVHPWRRNTQRNWMYVLTRKVSDIQKKWDFLKLAKHPSSWESQKVLDLLLLGRL